MERLQIAIEKARQNRSAQAQALAIAEPDEPAEVEAPVAAAPAAQPAPQAEDPWLALPELVLKPKSLQRRRVVTLQSGPSTLPFDLLRTRILQQAAQDGLRRVAIVSPHSSAGKTTLVANLSFCFGRQQDLKTLVLDFDLRRPGLATILGQAPRHSNADVVKGKVPFASHALRYGSNLAFALNRAPTRNASELLQSRDTAQCLRDLEETYQPDFMLFDMPPVLATDDTLGFMRQVDAALIVVEAERTPVRQIETVEAQVGELTKVLGVVLNRCNYVDRNAGEYGYY